MQKYARIVGIDVGKKRVGIARTDLLKTIASPVGTFPPEEVIPLLKEMAEDAPIDKFVVGWPLTPQGEKGRATTMVENFLEKLHQSFPDIAVVKIDERYTSNKAVKIMVEAGVPQKKRREKGRVDRIAAAIILQDYLESNY